MRIYYLSGSRVPSVTANSVHVMKMCQAFSKNGHDVVLFSRETEATGGDDFSFYGVDSCFKIIKRKWPEVRGIGGVSYAYQIYKALNKMELPGLFYGRDLYSLNVIATLGIPLIYEVHTPPTNIWRYYLEKRLISSKYFKKLVVISEALRSAYLDIFPKLDDGRITVAHDGADRNFVLDDKTQMERDNDPFAVGYVGQLYPGKGMEIIVELAHIMPYIEFHVVGGTESDILHWKEVASLPNLKYHGFIPHGKLTNYFKMFDVMLAPYQERVSGYGGTGDISKWMSPLKIFEYMSYAKPIIASDLPVLREVLYQGKNSILCKPTCIDEWIEAINTLRCNRDLRRKLGQEAYNHFIQHYTWESRGRTVLA